jgi:hypothetical protein
MSDRPKLNVGAGWFKFEDRAAGHRGYVRVFYYVPNRIGPAARPLIALHGLDRAASAFRDVFVPMAERLGKIAFVPEFDIQAFPDVYAYNYGNVVSSPPHSQFQESEVWSFNIVDRLFLSVGDANGFRFDGYDLYGNSAGSQFVLRYLALMQSPFLKKTISSNSGIYMLPDLELSYPNGMGGVGLDETDLRRYFSRPLYILLGDADTDAKAPDLPRSPEALAQGPHRLARGLWHYEHCRTLAQKLGVELAWTVEIVPGAGHISQAIFDRAMVISG